MFTMKSKRITYSRICKALPVTLLVSAISTALYAEESTEDEEQEGLNVVVVTSQTRLESAQDIPISLTVISAEQLNSSGIEKIDDLQYKVPNLQMTETGVSTQMYIRGIGSGNNQGFEQSVGQYIDGIYYGRQQLIRAPFLDLERVEVLRGPQSILFGKNSVAGALNMTSVKPTEDFEARLGIQYIPEFGSLETTAVISGGITDDFSARLAIRDFSEDGYIKNTTVSANHGARDEVGRDEFAVRASFKWIPSDKVDINLKIEQDNFDGVGRQIEIVRDDPFVAPVNLDTILTSIGLPDAIGESDLNFERTADNEESSNNELTNITLTADFEFDEYTLTSTTGLVSYEFTEVCDCDYIAASVFNVDAFEEYDQFSQEFRVLSPIGESFDWVGGVFYQTNEMNAETDIIVPTDSILGALNPALVAISGKNAYRINDADSDLWAVFFQANWHLSERWELTLGGRYTAEEKKATKEMNIIDAATRSEESLNGAAAQVFFGALGIVSEQLVIPGVADGHNLEGSRDESSFTPLLSLQYQPTDDLMFYGSYVTGFKAGGFDAQASITTSFEFEEEEATSFEFGLKSTLFDNTLEANIAVYRTDYDNLQVSQFDGVLGFVVGNAKETRVQGVEVDGRWWITDELTMIYSLGYLDHEFVDFQNGNCASFQAPDGSLPGLCDYSGKSGQYTPSFSGNVALQYEKSVDFGIFDYFTTTLSAYHSSSQNVDVNLNPLFEIDGYTKLDFRIALEGENFSVALFGRNVTDEEILTYVGNVPLSIGSFGTNTFYGFVDRPASYGLQLSYQL